MIGAFILLILIFYGAVVVAAIGLIALNAALDAAAQKVATPIEVILCVVLGCFAIYAYITTTFFIPAVVVAENRIGLSRSWALGRGNFWRIVGIMLIISFPVSLAASTISSSLAQMAMGPDMVNMQVEMNSPAEAKDVFKTVMAAFYTFGPYFIGLQVLQMIILQGLNGGAIAAAYRAVTGGDERHAKAPA